MALHIKSNEQFWSYPAHFLLDWEMFRTKVLEKITMNISCPITFFFAENFAVYEIKWQNMVEPDRPQMAIWSMRIAYWITKATDTLRQCNTYCLSTATMVSERRLIITLNLYCLSCWRKASLLYCHNWTSWLTAWNSCSILRTPSRVQALMKLRNFNLRNCRLEKF